MFFQNLLQPLNTYTYIHIYGKCTDIVLWIFILHKCVKYFVFQYMFVPESFYLTTSLGHFSRKCRFSSSSSMLTAVEEFMVWTA